MSVSWLACETNGGLVCKGKLVYLFKRESLDREVVLDQ